MKRSIPEKEKDSIFSKLETANKRFFQIYPGDLGTRQAVHTVYGGANLFRKDMPVRMKKSAMHSLRTYAPDFASFGRVFGIEGFEYLPITSTEIEALSDTFSKGKKEDYLEHPAFLSWLVFNKVVAKLEKEPLEDFRIDFEDGFGNRSDEEEDKIAVQAAEELAKGMEDSSLPPFIGIRIKPFTEDLKERGVRTLDVFLSALSELTNGKLPKNFVVMLPKVSIPEQVDALVEIFELIEANTLIPGGALKMEFMVETTQAIMDSEGVNPLRKLILASKGRCIAAAFGTYDYTASSNITAKYQEMGHPVCDFAHHMTKVALSHTGIFLADGASNVMPVAPHRGDKLSPEQIEENFISVHKAWKKGYDHNRHSLWNGLYQGWDLHPSQLVSRYAAVYAFFLESYSDATKRLKNFMESLATVSLSGDIFDDAATGQGLLNYFLRAMNSGAITEDEITESGLSIKEIRTRSFYKILKMRQKKK